jgi:GT2 family glycosyltransferase
MSPETEASIVVLTFNNLELTRGCLESVFARTGDPVYEVIIVDNASQDGTVQFLHEIGAAHPNVKLILNAQNQGFARGNNQGAKVAEGDYLVFLNNDTVVTQGWLSGLIQHLQDPQVGMVGPVTNTSGNETRIQVDYTGLEGMELFAGRYQKLHAGQAFEIKMLPLQCVAMRRQVFEEIGPLDERFGTGTFEDDDYALRLKQKGYRILCAEDVFIHHWGSASFSRLPRLEYLALFSENWTRFEQKWGIKWYPPTYRQDLVPEQLRQYLFDVLRLSFEVDGKNKEIEGLQMELNDLKSSNSWKLAERLQKIRLSLIPEGSWRERLILRKKT